MSSGLEPPLSRLFRYQMNVTWGMNVPEHTSYDFGGPPLDRYLKRLVQKEDHCIFEDVTEKYSRWAGIWVMSVASLCRGQKENSHRCTTNGFNHELSFEQGSKRCSSLWYWVAWNRQVVIYRHLSFTRLYVDVKLKASCPLSPNNSTACLMLHMCDAGNILKSLLQIRLYVCAYALLCLCMTLQNSGTAVTRATCLIQRDSSGESWVLVDTFQFFNWSSRRWFLLWFMILYATSKTAVQRLHIL